jgi:hypothetical protein
MPGKVSSIDLSQTVLQHPLTTNISTSSTGKGSRDKQHTVHKEDI